mmetsp:Transcript_37154/g.72977  ORF Transcript_37154/g.72977 Transcript_37154/m.72977 type:complete len:311 (-) Transcript_37154:675-1607(-)
MEVLGVHTFVCEELHTELAHVRPSGQIRLRHQLFDTPDWVEQLWHQFWPPVVPVVPLRQAFLVGGQHLYKLRLVMRLGSVTQERGLLAILLVDRLVEIQDLQVPLFGVCRMVPVVHKRLEHLRLQKGIQPRALLGAVAAELGLLELVHHKLAGGLHIVSVVLPRLGVQLEENTADFIDVDLVSLLDRCGSVASHKLAQAVVQTVETLVGQVRDLFWVVAPDSECVGVKVDNNNTIQHDRVRKVRSEHSSHKGHRSTHEVHQLLWQHWDVDMPPVERVEEVGNPFSKRQELVQCFSGEQDLAFNQDSTEQQ